MKSVLVMGLGNLLLFDEGFGIHVIREFERRYEVGDEVEVVDGGCPGFFLTDYLVGKSLVLLVDVVCGDGSEGDYAVFSKEDLLSLPITFFESPHQVGLVEALKFAEFAGVCPELKVFAAVPRRICPGVGLSEKLKAEVLPEAILWIKRELERAGVRVEERRRCA